MLVVATVTGGAFYAAVGAHLRLRAGVRAPAGWIDVTFIAVWLSVLAAAVRARLGAGGVRVAAFAIVPLVLLASPVLSGLRALVSRGAQPVSERAAGERRGPACDDGVP